MKEGTVRMRGHADEVMNRPVTAAVIVAAGASTRMGSPSSSFPCGDSGHRVYLVRLRTGGVDRQKSSLVARQGAHAAILRHRQKLRHRETDPDHRAGQPAGIGRQRGLCLPRRHRLFSPSMTGARPLIRPEIIDAVAAAAYPGRRRRHGRRAGEGYGQGIERRRV